MQTKEFPDSEAILNEIALKLKDLFLTCASIREGTTGQQMKKKLGKTKLHFLLINGRKATLEEVMKVVQVHPFHSTDER